MLKLIPFDDYVVVERVKGDQVSAGGVLLPEQEKNRSTRGKIVAMGPGKLFVAEANTNDRCFLPLRPTQAGGPKKDGIAVGDIVLFANYAGSEYTEGGVDYTILAASDIRAKIVEEPK